MSMNTEERQQQLTIALGQVKLPPEIKIRQWSENDFPAIQRLSLSEDWTSPTQRIADSLRAWQHSWPALVEACHSLYPTTRLDLLATKDARAFYKACGFRVVHDGMRKSYV